MHVLCKLIRSIPVQRAAMKNSQVCLMRVFCNLTDMSGQALLLPDPWHVCPTTITVCVLCVMCVCCVCVVLCGVCGDVLWCVCVCPVLAVVGCVCGVGTLCVVCCVVLCCLCAVVCEVGEEEEFWRWLVIKPQTKISVH